MKILIGALIKIASNVYESNQAREREKQERENFTAFPERRNNAFNVDISKSKFGLTLAKELKNIARLKNKGKEISQQLKRPTTNSIVPCKNLTTQLSTYQTHYFTNNNERNLYHPSFFSFHMCEKPTGIRKSQHSRAGLFGGAKGSDGRTPSGSRGHSSGGSKSNNGHSSGDCGKCGGHSTAASRQQASLNAARSGGSKRR